MEDESKEAYQALRKYLRKRWKKIVGWIVFIFGIWSVVGGFFVPVNFILGIPLTIAGAILLRQELKRLHFRQVISAGPVLVILGLILIVVGIPFLLFTPGILGWGVILLIIGLPLATTHRVLKQHVQGEWSYLIEGAKGKAEEIFKATEDFVKKSGVSSITMKRQELIPGFIRGALGRKREFLVVKDRHFRLKPYQFLLNVIDYGNNLNVAWYLTYRLSIIRAFLMAFPFVNLIPQKIGDLDLFDLQDLKAFNTVCHHSVLQAVEKLILSLNQDPSKIDRKSRGFLGIS